MPIVRTKLKKYNDERRQSFFKNPIFILGLPRSGTSMIAGSLHLCGAWVGETIPGGGIENPEGFFENRFLREAVYKKILAGTKADPLGIEPLPDLETLPQVNDLYQTAYDLLNHEGYDFKQPWRFKEPKLCLLWPVYYKAFPNARWIVVRRDEDAVIDSCMRTSFMARHGKDRIFWRQWTKEYLRRLDVLKTTVPYAWEIWSQPLIDGDLTDLRNLVEWLNLDWQERNSLIPNTGTPNAPEATDIGLQFRYHLPPVFNLIPHMSRAE